MTGQHSGQSFGDERVSIERGSERCDFKTVSVQLLALEL